MTCQLMSEVSFVSVPFAIERLHAGFLVAKKSKGSPGVNGVTLAEFELVTRLLAVPRDQRCSSLTRQRSARPDGQTRLACCDSAVRFSPALASTGRVRAT